MGRTSSYPPPKADHKNRTSLYIASLLCEIAKRSDINLSKLMDETLRLVLMQKGIDPSSGGPLASGKLEEFIKGLTYLTPPKPLESEAPEEEPSAALPTLEGPIVQKMRAIEGGFEGFILHEGEELRLQWDLKGRLVHPSTLSVDRYSFAKRWRP